MKTKPGNNIACTRILWVSFAVLLNTINVFTQTDYIVNGTFNGGFSDVIRPDGWQTCDYFSDPDVRNNYISTGSDPEVLPVDGPNFIGMRARGVNYLSEGNHLVRTREYIAQKLAKPLDLYSCFKFSAYLCYNQYNVFYDTIDKPENVAYPLTLEVWVGNDSCPHEKLLFTTKAVTNKNWLLYEATFCTSDTLYSTIRLQTQWDTLNIQIWNPQDYDQKPYNGEMFVDLVKLVKICSISDTLYDTLYYKGDGKTTLTARPGTLFQWEPKDYLNYPSPTDKRTVVMQAFTDDVSVVIQKTGICPIVDKFHVIFDCDSIYPKFETDTLYFKYFKNIFLQAFEGDKLKYKWSPDKNLSSDTIRNPRVLDIDTTHMIYKVDIHDNYNCKIHQYFEIEANCDSLVPGGYAIVMDTTLKDNTEIVLIPKVGSVVDCSWKPLKWLNTDNCQAPTTSALNNITYTVTVIDDFGCFHDESFVIRHVLRIPNVITPNSDGYNDSFIIVGLPDGTTIKIFNKEGTLIYSASHYNDSNCWKGTDNKGTPIETGTYWYVLDNKEAGLLKKGFVFLKR